MIHTQLITNGSAAFHHTVLLLIGSVLHPSHAVGAAAVSSSLRPCTLSTLTLLVPASCRRARYSPLLRFHTRHARRRARVLHPRLVDHRSICCPGWVAPNARICHPHARSHARSP
ncbi:hypothetical protein C8Q77DRAFT_572537 [Trametes polyzona]|nr:hypothetical protein C8Q77DRAFT_572537 [Trametes polyzona]